MPVSHVKFILAIYVSRLLLDVNATNSTMYKVTISVNMNLVLIYGPPATGKLTVAKALSKSTGYPILHNHVTIDMVTTLFDSDKKHFWDVNEKIRLLLVEEAIKAKLPGVIFTFCYEYKTDDKFIRQLTSRVKKEKGSVIFIHLYSKPKELARRVQHISRKKFEKIKTVQHLNKMLNECEFFKPIPFVESLRIDNTKLSVQKVVGRIRKHYKL